MAGRVERLLHAVDTPHDDRRLRAITKLARLVPTLDANDGRIVGKLMRTTYTVQLLFRLLETSVLVRRARVFVVGLARGAARASRSLSRLKSPRIYSPPFQGVLRAREHAHRVCDGRRRVAGPTF